MVSNSSKRTLDSYPTSSESNISRVKDNSSHGEVDHELAEVVVKLAKEDEGLRRKHVFDGGEEEEEGDNEHCVICLHEIRDRTILPCAHDRLCFECIFVWCQQSRKCPLCNASIGPYLIHNFRSDYDYSKHYLTPLPSSPVPNNLVRPSETRTAVERNRERWGRRVNAQTVQERADQFELAVSKRRWVYRHGLYALHVASNSHTRYRPAPTPAQFVASQDIITRATIFIRRELHVWINLDIEFLTTFTLSLMKSIDIRSESAIKLLAEFLDMDIPYHIGEPDEPSRGRFPNAEHFAHELYSYLRSPYKDLIAYDRAVQYDVPFDILPPPDKPLPNRYQRHWEAPSSSHQAHAESSQRSARREGSPDADSPHLRSPREAFSPSLPSSPSDDYDDPHQYQYRYRSRAVSRSSPRPYRSRSHSHSPRRRRERGDSFKYEHNKDTKGKGKTTNKTFDRSRSRSQSRSRLKHDTWKSNRAENASRTNDISKKRRRRSVSVSSDKDKDKYSVPPPRKSYRVKEKNVNNPGRHHFTRGEDPRRPGSTSNDPVRARKSSNNSGSPTKSRRNPSYSPPDAETRHESDRRQASTSTSDSKPRPSRAREDDNVDEAEVKINDDSRAPVAQTQIPADHLPDVPTRPNRGISIKGQAKLLAMGGEEGGKIGKAQPLSDSNRQTSFALEDPTNGTTSQTRQRKASELLHAHLLGNSLTAKQTNGSALGISSSASTSSPATAVFRADRSTEVSTNEKSDSVSSKNGRDITNLDVTPPNAPSSSDKVVSNPSHGMSAREIMARTRAKLAKLRGDLSMTDSQRNGGDLPMEVVAPNPKRSVSVTRLSATVRSYLLKQLEEEKKKMKDKMPAAPNDVHAAASEVMGHGPSENISEKASETLHAERELDPVSREESLKATLLSRIK